ncbi:MAG: hypothetical protein JXB15_17380 [Anaerolineales bacterium]|nr:hypothetical protein [Anaerolineales bacterium]
MRFPILMAGLLVAGMLSSCSGQPQNSLATPIPTEYLPTAIAQTLEASGLKPPPTRLASPTPRLASSTATKTQTKLAITKTPTSKATRTKTPSATHTQTVTEILAPESTPEPTLEPTESQAAALTPTLLSTPPTATPLPETPEGRIQIFRYGELSLVTSPIQVSAKLTSQVGKVVRVELYGEDGRMLARQVKIFGTLPWQVGNVNTTLDFEISGAAETGRLVISVEDVFGRLIDVNSVNLILLSTGVTELNPPTAVNQKIVIQEPAPKALIQGGLVYVAGLAQPNKDLPLRVALIAEDGRVLGQRLAGVSIPVPGGYGFFAAEVPYTVAAATEVLLVVYEEGQPVSDITYLSSTIILISP